MLRHGAWLGVLALLSSVTTLAGCAGPEVDDDGEEVAGFESAQRATRRLPSFAAMWNAYPHGSADEVKAMIGGRVDAEWITNTCTIRVSHALNEAGFSIPKGPATDVAGLHTVSGANGAQYAYRVRELNTWLRANVGAPTIFERAPDVVGVDPALFEGRQGIIMFEVNWSDADGHFDLWNGSEAAHEQYFEQAKSVALWEVE